MVHVYRSHWDRHDPCGGNPLRRITVLVLSLSMTWHGNRRGVVAVPHRPLRTSAWTAGTSSRVTSLRRRSSTSAQLCVRIARALHIGPVVVVALRGPALCIMSTRWHVAVRQSRDGAHLCADPFSCCRVQCGVGKNRFQKNMSQGDYYNGAHIIMLHILSLPHRGVCHTRLAAARWLSIPLTVSRCPCSRNPAAMASAKRCAHAHSQIDKMHACSAADLLRCGRASLLRLETHIQHVGSSQGEQGGQPRKEEGQPARAAEAEAARARRREGEGSNVMSMASPGAVAASSKMSALPHFIAMQDGKGKGPFGR